MDDINQCSCPNKDCRDYGKSGGANIAYRGKYGKDRDKDLLYCKTCGKRFASTQNTPLFGSHLSIMQVHQIIHHAAEGVSVRATARLLGLDKATVNLTIVKVGEHCQRIYRELMSSLRLTEVQLDELWTFVKKKRLLTKKNSTKV
jgi:transposase-like protein